MGKGLVEVLRSGLKMDEPLPEGLRTAAVAVILRERDAPCVLMIRRAERVGDPWSGQIAFPGGKTQAGDGTARRTAAREAKEEVGVDLEASAVFLGYGDALTTHTGTMNVVPVVFRLEEDVEVTPNGEVASYRWVELDRLVSAEARSTYRVGSGSGAFEAPASTVGDYVVWGLTHRILTSLLRDALAEGDAVAL